LVSKHFDIGPKFVSSERAVSAVRAGSRVYIGTGCAAPHSLLAALEAMNPGPADLEFVSFVTTSALPQVEGASRTHYRHRAFFVGSEMRSLAGSGQLEYVPISLEEVPLLLMSGRLPIDVALLQVSPPDARGFVACRRWVPIWSATTSPLSQRRFRPRRRLRSDVSRGPFNFWKTTPNKVVFECASCAPRQGEIGFAFQL
jgi:hypothetical protein